MIVEKIQIFLVLLGIVGVLAVVAELVRFPFPILCVIAGLLIGLVPNLPDAKLDPEVVFLVFLPPLLFSAAWNFPWDDFRSNFVPIFGLAVGLVFATILCVAYAAYFLIPGMTLAAGFVLGAIVSPPDAVAASAVLKNLRVPKRLSDILEGESLVNDASGLVAYQFAVAAVVTGSFSLGEAAGDFLWMAVGGTSFGLAVGIIAAHLHRRLCDPAVEVTLTILTPYIAYLPAERLGFSGVLAVVAAGLYIGHRSWEALRPESRLQRDTVWQLLDYLLNSVIFILIGLQFPTIVREMTIPVAQMIFIGVAISLVVIAVRFLWVFPMVSLERYFFRRGEKNYLSFGELVVASWAGMRGVVSLAAALALPLSTLDRRGLSAPPYHLVSHVLCNFHHLGPPGSFLALARSQTRGGGNRFRSRERSRSAQHASGGTRRRNQQLHREGRERWLSGITRTLASPLSGSAQGCEGAHCPSGGNQTLCRRQGSRLAIGTYGSHPAPPCDHAPPRSNFRGSAPAYRIRLRHGRAANKASACPT